jgi:plasmid stability protein
MLRTQIQLNERQVAALKAEAAATGTSMAELIRRCIDQTLTSALVPEQTQPAQRAIAAAGRFRSGRGDLAANHDKYLTETYGK